MIEWGAIFYFSIISAALLLSVLGAWFTAVIPGIDRWSKRFFLCYFIVFFLCSVSGLIEIFFELRPVSGTALYFALVAECLILSIPLPMLTVYLLHCRGEDIRKSKLLRAVTGLWAGYSVLIVSSPFIGVFSYIASDNLYDRGPLYPLLLLPLIAILLLNFTCAVEDRKQLSRKVFLSFLVAILPMTLTLTVQMFVDVFPLFDISYVVSAMSMYGLILSDQIEQDRRNQQEIARQQQEIAHERASVMVLQMRPHFIYNTLMGIYSLINQDPQKARQVTADFTDYLRKNFNAVTSDHTIPFSAELEHTQAYLAVEQAQHEEMLLVEYDTPFTRFRLPPLTMQPLVENAVKHGMDPYAGPLHVSVRTRQTEVGAVITVEDDGKGFDPADDSGRHTTLTNIRQRLDMMCSGTMEIASHEGSGTRVTIRIPTEKPEEER